MKIITLFLPAFFTLTFCASAHVGSPNVFFEGQAGTYSLYAVIRPPAVLPGAAQVSVRVNDPDVRSVSLLPVLWQAGRQGSPQPVAAQRVPGETNLWSGEVWFLRPGSYTLQVGIQGPRGAGEATVPVNATATQSRQMGRGLSTTLVVLGSLLFISALFIVRAVAREGRLEPSDEPAISHSSGARWAVVMAALILAGGVTGGAVRWRNMDSAYRAQGIQKPEPVMAVVRTEAERILLELRQAEQTMSQPSWAALVPDHGKLMHLFLVREPTLDVFGHLHPVRTDARTFKLEVPSLPAGDYQLYGDVTFENGMSQTLVSRVVLPEPVGGPFALPPLVTNLAGEVFCGFPPALVTNVGQIARDMDDSWHVAQSSATIPANHAGGLVSRLMGGNTLLFENAAEVAAGQATSLRFAVFAPDGSEANLQTYMGMLGHAAVRRADGSVFAHLHPLGSFSMASQDVFRKREGIPGNDTGASVAEKAPPNRVSFPYQFPKPGTYRLWIQVRVAGRVLTGVFDLEVKSGA